jgi:hypothetical protein
MNSRLPRRRRPLAAAVAACLALATIAPCAYAAYDNVQNCNDTGSGSLRNTVASAATGDTVVLNPVTMQCSVITVGSGEIVVPQNDLTVKYNGNNSNRFTLSGNEHRIFHHTGTGKLTLQRLNLQFGTATDADAIVRPTGKYTTVNEVAGGCVYSAGVVDLENSQVKYCSVSSNPSSNGSFGVGGGIYAGIGLIMNNSVLRNNSVTAYASPTNGSYARCGGANIGGIFSAGNGYLNVNDSTIRDNAAGGSGGGLCIGVQSNPAPQSTIRNSTLSGNSAASTSAIYARGPLAIENSTISGNSATGTAYSVSAIFAGENLTLSNTTVAFNRAANGAAIWLNYQQSGGKNNYTANFESSIVANNISNETESDVYTKSRSVPPTISGANNIVMSASANLALPGDTLARDPLLLPLADNGGTTQTHGFRDGSPAFGNGSNPSGFANDQRGSGFARTIDGATDIGAFQQQARDVVFANGFD